MRRMPRRLFAQTVGAALILLALAPVGMPSGHRVVAADRGLVAVMQTRYDAVPDQRLVRATIDAVATSYTPDSDQGRAFYSGFKVSIPAGARSVSASSDGGKLAVRLGAVDGDFRTLEVTFSRDVFYQESYAFRVVFQLPDTGGAPDRDLRVGSNIVAFSVLAFGSPGEAGSGVTVVLPAGFRASVQGSKMITTTGSDGEVVLRALNLRDPFDFFAYLAADRPGTFGEHHLTATVAGKPAALWIRSWEDDPEWGVRMSDLLTRGLPVLQGMIGLPYGVSGTLTVEEAAPTLLGDYAGTYTQTTGTILARYDADAYIGLHEAAHIWFNETLLHQRWINEGWAEFYGVEAAKAIGELGTAFSLTDDLLAARIPLNDWGVAAGAIDDTVHFGYAASYHVAGLIFARTGFDGLRAVWRGMANGEMSYQPLHGSAEPDRRVDSQLADWQQVLDLLDERTGQSFDDIWKEWIVDPAQLPLLSDRAVARGEYATLRTRAAGWNLPIDLRYAMSSWKFADAETDIGVAGDVLDARDQIVTDAARLGLTAPSALKRDFEGSGGLGAAQQEAATELDVLAGIAAATDRLNDDESLFETIGLLGAEPEAALESARTAFEADHLGAAAAAAAEAVATRAGAEGAGQLRTGIAGGGVLVLGGGLLVGVRVQRRRSAAVALAARAATVPIDPPSPDAAV
jgi:hypothetical protein